MLFSSFSEVLDLISSTSKRLEKTAIISDFIKKTKKELIPIVIILFQGRVLPTWDERNLGFSSKLMVRAITYASGVPEKKVVEQWKKTGDLGNTAEIIMEKRGQKSLFQKELSIKDVFETLKKLSSLEGIGSTNTKIKIVAGLLNSAKSGEIKYIVRLVLEELRVGIAEGTIRDAIVWAFSDSVKYNKESNSIDIINKEKYNEFIEAVQSAFDRCNDFSIVAEAASEGLKAIKNIPLKVFTPIRVMLAQKEPSIADSFKRVGKPAALEFKYDGFRVCIHKKGDKIKLFTRRLEDVTNQFPDVIEAVKKNVKGNEFILDSEVVGLEKEKRSYLPFQTISQRIKRKYDISDILKKFPVEVNVFDIIYNGENLLNTPFKQRRKILESMVSYVPGVIKPSEMMITNSESEAEEFFKRALKAGTEGLMFKNLEGLYNPGSRVGHMVKFKLAMDTFDVVILGAEWGTGKRSGWFTSFKIAVLGMDKEILPIGKVGTGIKEIKEEGLSFEELTNLLKPLIIEEYEREVVVKPTIVVEVAFEEIQKSTAYESGYALRFPRIIKYRPDRGVTDITTIDEVDKAFRAQIKRK